MRTDYTPWLVLLCILGLGSLVGVAWHVRGMRSALTDVQRQLVKAQADVDYWRTEATAASGERDALRARPPTVITVRLPCPELPRVTPVFAKEWHYR